MAAESALRLSLLVMSPADLRRMQREVASLDDYLHQAGLRGGKKQDLKLPRTSRSLEDMAAVNGLNLLLKPDRLKLKSFLEQMATSSPVVTISFAADPSAAFLGKLVSWFRQNIHPALLIKTGLQPNIAAGCVVRTSNRYFDFSLRQRFTEQQQLLIDHLRQGSGAGG